MLRKLLDNLKNKEKYMKKNSIFKMSSIMKTIKAVLETIYNIGVSVAASGVVCL